MLLKKFCGKQILLQEDFKNILQQIIEQNQTKYYAEKIDHIKYFCI